MGHSHLLACKNRLVPSLTVLQEEPLWIFLRNFCLVVAQRQNLRIRALTGPEHRNLKVGVLDTHISVLSITGLSKATLGP
jgi:hypothetical protein